MCKVISFENYRRTRRDTLNMPRRAPPKPQGGQGLVSIGIVSAELLRRLTETE